MRSWHERSHAGQLPAELPAELLAATESTENLGAPAVDYGVLREKFVLTGTGFADARADCSDTVHVGGMNDLTTATDATTSPSATALERAKAAYEAALQQAADEEAAARKEAEEAARRAASDSASRAHLGGILGAAPWAVLPKMLTQAQLADVIGVSPRTLEAWRFEKRGPRYVKLSNLVRYPVHYIQAWLREADPALEFPEVGDVLGSAS